MHKRDFSHHAWRSSQATSHTHSHTLQLLIGLLSIFGSWSTAFRHFGLEPTELFHYRSDSVIAARFDYLTANELVGINVADKLAQRDQVLVSRPRLIVVRNNVQY